MQTPEGSQVAVAALYRYPVKGLTPEPLESVDLKSGETLPFDRAYAIENGPGRFDPEAPRHLPKIAFLMLMRDERLATLRSTFDDATQTLTISRGGKPVVSGRLDTPLGRQLIEQFIAAYMKAELRGAPKIVLRAGPQLLRCGRQVRAHRQPGERARAASARGPQGRSAALSRQRLCGWAERRGRSSTGWTRRSASARRA